MVRERQFGTSGPRLNRSMFNGRTTGLNSDQEHRTCSLTIPMFASTSRRTVCSQNSDTPMTEKEGSKMFVTHQSFVHRLYRDMAAAVTRFERRSKSLDNLHYSNWNIPSYSPQLFNGTTCYTSNKLERIPDSQCMPSHPLSYLVTITRLVTLCSQTKGYFLFYETLH